MMKKAGKTVGLMAALVGLITDKEGESYSPPTLEQVWDVLDKHGQTRDDAREVIALLEGAGFGNPYGAGEGARRGHHLGHRRADERHLLDLMSLAAIELPSKGDEAHQVNKGQVEAFSSSKPEPHPIPDAPPGLDDVGRF